MYTAMLQKPLGKGKRKVDFFYFFITEKEC